MTENIQIRYYQRVPLPKMVEVTLYCCRAWTGPLGYPPVSCGYCGEVPTAKPDGQAGAS